jgi:hypothetical protein
MAAASIGACATTPEMDGGIVGTGNRMDCERQTKSDGTRTSAPQECERKNTAR